MTETDTDAAAAWASRLSDGPLDAETDQALSRWLAEAPGRSGALLRAEACLERVRRHAVMSGSARTVEPDDGERAVAGRRRFLGWSLAGGGAVAAAILAGVIILPRSETRYATTVGELRRVPLNDGSVASINTASAMRVTMDGNTRRVTLDRGEAWFQVAHDRGRPFTVEAGGVRVRAVGTAFSVRRRDGGADVLVTEGVVEASTGPGGAAVRISAGEGAFLAENGMPARTMASAETLERALAWRRGEMVLDGETLGYAAAEINRYNHQQIAIDPTFADQTLVGYFRANDPRAFAQAAAALTGGVIVSDSQTLVVRPNRSSDAPAQ